MKTYLLTILTILVAFIQVSSANDEATKGTDKTALRRMKGEPGATKEKATKGEVKIVADEKTGDLKYFSMSPSGSFGDMLEHDDTSPAARGPGGYLNCRCLGYAKTFHCFGFQSCDGCCTKWQEIRDTWWC